MNSFIWPFLKMYFVYVVHVCACRCVPDPMAMCMSTAVRRGRWVSCPLTLYLIPLRQGLSLNLMFTILAH